MEARLLQLWEINIIRRLALILSVGLTQLSF